MVQTQPTSWDVLVGDAAALREVCGERDENLRWIEARAGVEALVRGPRVVLRGAPAAVRAARALLQPLLDAADVPTEHDDAARPQAWTVAGRPIRARSDGQAAYLAALAADPLVFGLGPAGCGKSYLAVAAALAALERREIKRIVLTRPAVEAGERLGFLPGDLTEKVHPYLRPLFDALGELLDPARVAALVEQGVVEVAPLAFMRGRTLSSAFVILDEAQNCTPEQVAMLLTRLGHRTRAAVTGDPSQSDLPRGRPNGLEHATRVLGALEGVSVVHFGPGDIVRSPLVARIVAAYGRDAEATLVPGGPSLADAARGGGR